MYSLDDVHSSLHASSGSTLLLIFFPLHCLPLGTIIIGAIANAYPGRMYVPAVLSKPALAHDIKLADLFSGCLFPLHGVNLNYTTLSLEIVYGESQGMPADTSHTLSFYIHSFRPWCNNRIIISSEHTKLTTQMLE